MKKYKKLILITHQRDLREIVFALMKLRSVALCEIPEEYRGVYKINPREPENSDSLEKISFAIDVLSQGGKRSAKAPKIKADTEKFLEEKIDAKASYTVEQTLAAEARKKEIAEEIEKYRALAAKFEPYLDYELPLGLKKTARTSVIFGFFPPRTDLSAVGKKLYAAGAVADNFKTDRNGIFVSVFCHADEDGKVRDVLSEYGFTAADFEEGLDKAPVVHGEYMRKVTALVEESAKLSDREKAMAAGLNAIKILYDIEKSRLNFLSYLEKIGMSGETALVCGCFPASEEIKITGTLGLFDCAYSIEDVPKDKSPRYIKKLAYADDEKSLTKIKQLQDKNKHIFLPMVMSATYSDLSAAN